jgi:hypothetical protein
MLRTVLSVVAGVATWFVAVTVLNLGLRYGWPAYHAAEPAMTFDVTMMAARLIESTVALILAALVTGNVARGAPAAPWILGVVMLAIFIPVHLALWPKFPVWYHLTFLTSLVVVPVVAGRWARRPQ